ncbi:MAG: hypothetical protein WEG56_01520 [Chloroflexota bacterium]
MGPRPATGPVTVVILHPEPPADAGPLVRAVVAARAQLAEEHLTGFLAAGATDARIATGVPDGLAFGARLRALAGGLAADAGLVILGSGAVPLITTTERRAFVAAAADPDGAVLTNNRYSADIIAIARARDALRDLPDLATDNALPRWLAGRPGVEVRGLRRRWRLGVDIDSPLDLVLLGGERSRHVAAADRAAVEGRLAALRDAARDPGAELVIAGRTSAATLAWLERQTAARTRALVEERGLRTSAAGQRPPASVIGLLLDRDGPDAIGEHLARLGDAALVDSRVLLAHRLGPDEAAWPPPEDRFASDLLLADRVADPWLRALTAAAAAASIPVLLGGHTLVGPGLRLALRTGRAGPRHA